MSTLAHTQGAGVAAARYQLDPEIAAALAPLAAAAAGAPVIKRGDWRALRESANANLAFLAILGPPVADDVQMRSLCITVDDGEQVAARWYTRGDQRPGSAVVRAHGGGLIAGDLDAYDAAIAEYVTATSVPFLSGRLSPGTPRSTIPTPSGNCSTSRWRSATTTKSSPADHALNAQGKVIGAWQTLGAASRVRSSPRSR